jgi:outer membrane biosynthesis protein TonB
MPILIFLRQYGLREYGFVLAAAVVVGVGIPVLINSTAGGAAGAPATLKTKEELADASSRVLTTRVFKPVRTTHPAPVRRHRARRHHRSHRARPSAPAPVVAVRAPARVRPVQARTVTPHPSPAPAPAPKPVVRTPAPAPAPKPKPKPKPAAAPKPSPSVQFDDSG